MRDTINNSLSLYEPLSTPHIRTFYFVVFLYIVLCYIRYYYASVAIAVLLCFCLFCEFFFVFSILFYQGKKFELKNEFLFNYETLTVHYWFYSQQQQ